VRTLDQNERVNRDAGVETSECRVEIDGDENGDRDGTTDQEVVDGWMHESLPNQGVQAAERVGLRRNGKGGRLHHRPHDVKKFICCEITRNSASPAAVLPCAHTLLASDRAQVDAAIKERAARGILMAYRPMGISGLGSGGLGRRRRRRLSLIALMDGADIVPESDADSR
jgi:hypothetical protein